MLKFINLNQHFSLTSEKEVSKIVAPFVQAFDIKHFRYLKLYNDGSRVLLTNFSDCARFMYEEGHYKQMWFDGEFPELLTEGCHVWDVLRVANSDDELSPLEKEINLVLGLYHGMTFVKQGVGFHELYTFDSHSPDIYNVDQKLFSHFMFYFKAQAKKLIRYGEEEKIYTSSKKPAKINIPRKKNSEAIQFLKKTEVNRYYLGGQYRDVYLTMKEVRCVFWLAQGKSAAEIAIIEGNSFKTIETHLENVRRKLNCYKQTQLVRIILEAGIFQDLQLYLD